MRERVRWVRLADSRVQSPGGAPIGLGGGGALRMCLERFRVSAPTAPRRAAPRRGERIRLSQEYEAPTPGATLQPMASAASLAVSAPARPTA